MQFLKTRKTVALVGAVVVVAIAAVGAYAYFTSTGSGTGSATVGLIRLGQSTRPALTLWLSVRSIRTRRWGLPGRSQTNSYHVKINERRSTST